MAMGYGNDGNDTASILEDEFRAHALKAQQGQRTVENNNDDVFCLNEVCGEEIPLPRRTAIPGVRFCITCQGKAETALKRSY